MKVRIASHVSWFLLPAVQWTSGFHGEFYGHWPWSLVLWWGKCGLQLEGASQRSLSA